MSLPTPEECREGRPNALGWWAPNENGAMFAAWVVTLCPDRDFVKQHEPEILATLAHFRADKLRFVSFFPLECAWWRLQPL